MNLEAVEGAMGMRRVCVGGGGGGGLVLRVRRIDITLVNMFLHS